VSGLWVRVWGSILHPGGFPFDVSASSETQTDAAGQFNVVTRQPITGAADVFLSPSGGARWTYRPARITVATGGTVEGVEIELVEGVEVIGRVVDADCGDPVEGVTVGVATPSPGGLYQMVDPAGQTDERGEFRLLLPSGESELMAYRFPTPYEPAYPNGVSIRVNIPGDARSFAPPVLKLRSHGGKRGPAAAEQAQRP
jgi:hypothetical protein